MVRKKGVNSSGTGHTAGTDEEMEAKTAALAAQMTELKENYETRTSALETRVGTAESGRIGERGPLSLGRWSCMEQSKFEDNLMSRVATMTVANAV